MKMTELRLTLSDEIKKLKNGTRDPKVANAIVNAAGKIIASVRLELDYAKMVGKPPNVPLLGK